MHSFQSDVLAAVAVVDAKALYSLTPVGTAAAAATTRTPCVGTCSPGFAGITGRIEKRRTANRKNAACRVGVSHGGGAILPVSFFYLLSYPRIHVFTLCFTERIWSCVQRLLSFVYRICFKNVLECHLLMKPTRRD